MFSLYPRDFDDYCDATGWDRDEHRHADGDDIDETADRFRGFCHTLPLCAAFQGWVAEHLRLYVRLRRRPLCEQYAEVMRFAARGELWSAFYGHPHDSAMRRFGVPLAHSDLTYRTIVSRAYLASDESIGIVEGVGERIASEVLYIHRTALAFCLGLSEGRAFDARLSHCRRSALSDPFDIDLREPDMEGGAAWMCAAGREGFGALIDAIESEHPRISAAFDAGDVGYCAEVPMAEEGELVATLFDGRRPSHESFVGVVTTLENADALYHGDAAGPARYVWCLLDSQVADDEERIARAVAKQFAPFGAPRDIWLRRRLRAEVGAAERDRVWDRIVALMYSAAGFV